MTTITTMAVSVTTTKPILSPNQREATVFYGLRCLGMIDPGDLDISSYYSKENGFTEKGLRKIVAMLAKENKFADPGRLNIFVEMLKNDIAGKLRSGEIAKSPDDKPASIYQTAGASMLPLIPDPLAMDVAHAKMAYMALGIMDHKTFADKCGLDWTYYSTEEQKATQYFQNKFNVPLTEKDQPGRLGKKTVAALADALESRPAR